MTKVWNGLVDAIAAAIQFVVREPWSAVGAGVVLLALVGLIASLVPA